MHKKAWMCLNFGQIPLLTTEVAALERLKNQCFHFFSIAINPNLLKLSGKEDKLTCKCSSLQTPVEGHVRSLRVEAVEELYLG